MRPVLLKTGCLLILGFSTLLSAKSFDGNVRVRLRLVDADSGNPRAGIVRIVPADGETPLALPGLFDRLHGLQRSEGVAGWYVVPAAGAETSLPRKKLRLEALSGLETELARREIDMSASAPEEIALKLPPVFNPAQLGLAAGNTHLHLMKLTQNESDEYLRQVPAADGLQVLFISYLERHKDDVAYITNRYPIGELKQFAATGVLYSNGQEHRHNFEAYGQGYGHVMFLGIRNLVRPVSLGQGLTGAGFDDRPLRLGIDDARGQKGTVIWCHNTNGHEDVPSALSGRLDALNFFDGSRSGKLEDNYYRYLNIGLRMPISTGTDWFMYDFSRVYAKSGRLAPRGETSNASRSEAATLPALTLQSWLDAVKAGRTVATNSPLLTLRVDGRDQGDTLNLEQPRTLRVEGTGIGRHDFQRLQLVHNGKPVFEQAAAKKAGHYEARFTRDVRIDTPGWLALRIDSITRNELGAVLYAHSSPVYVDVSGRRIFDLDAAQALLRQVEEGRADIRARGRFSSPAAADKLLALYEDAAADLQARMSRRGK